MATLAENVDRVVAAKAAIALAITEKGVAIPDGTGLSGLSALVSRISAGKGTACTVALATTDGSLSVETVDGDPLSFEKRYYRRADLSAAAAYVDDSVGVGSAKSAFYGCSSLAFVGLHGERWRSCTSCDSLFCNCKKLAAVSFPDFGRDAASVRMMFYNCQALASLTFPNEFGYAATLADSMFYGCSSLKEIALPAAFGTHLADCRNMFRSCTSLARVVLPPGFGNALTTAPTYLFHDCPALEEIEVAGGEGAPYACPSALDLSGSPKLSRDSLVGLISYLPDGMADGTSVLTLGGTLMAKLTDADALAAIESAKARNWTIE